jgi:hypothetical protein
VVAAPEKGAAASSAHVPLCQDEEDDDDDQEAMVRVLIQLKDWEERGSEDSEEMEPLPALVKTDSTEKLDTVGNQIKLREKLIYVSVDGASHSIYSQLNALAAGI